jgi:hypothetical protein
MITRTLLLLLRHTSKALNTGSLASFVLRLHLVHQNDICSVCKNNCCGHGFNLPGIRNQFRGIKDHFCGIGNYFCGIGNRFCGIGNPFRNIINRFRNIINHFRGIRMYCCTMQNCMSTAGYALPHPFQLRLSFISIFHNL